MAAKKTVQQIDDEVDLILSVRPPGLTSAKLKKLGKAYRHAHPGFTRDGNYADDVYVTANRIYALAEGYARAENSDRRMKRQGLR